MPEPVYISTSDQDLQFFSLKGKAFFKHEIVAWKLSADDKANPILFPEPITDAIVAYQRARSDQVTVLNTGVTYKNMQLAIEAQP